MPLNHFNWQGSDEDAITHENSLIDHTSKGPLTSFLSSIKSFLVKIWTWCVDIFSEPVNPVEELKQVKFELVRRLKSYVRSNKTIDCNKAQDCDKQLIDKENAALSLLFCINPDTKIHGKRIEIKDNKLLVHQKNFLSRNWAQMNLDNATLARQQERPLNEWYRLHQVDEENSPEIDADYLNYHRTTHGRMLHRFFGVDTKSMSLLKQAMQLEEDIAAAKSNLFMQ